MAGSTDRSSSHQGRPPVTEAGVNALQLGWLPIERHHIDIGRCQAAARRWAEFTSSPCSGQSKRRTRRPRPAIPNLSTALPEQRAWGASGGILERQLDLLQSHKRRREDVASSKGGRRASAPGSRVKFEAQPPAHQPPSAAAPDPPPAPAEVPPAPADAPPAPAGEACQELLTPDRRPPRHSPRHKAPVAMPITLHSTAGKELLARFVPPFRSGGCFQPAPPSRPPPPRSAHHHSGGSAHGSEAETKGAQSPGASSSMPIAWREQPNDLGTLLAMSSSPTQPRN
eukprot:Hpha_TRINITY_DN15089_c0_g2::TRINITY_DN15089_c0_g2_i1::g.125839::m.125839